MKQGKSFDKINAGAIQNGKRFTFCQNEYILRTSSIMEMVHMENEVKGMIVGIIGIAVTIVSIIVTVISIIQSYRNHKHQKSNRPTKE